MRKPTFILLLFLSLSLGASAQSFTSIRVSLIGEQLSLPLSFSGPMAAGLEVSTDIRFREKEKSNRLINLSLTAFSREGVNNTFYLMGSYEHQAFLGESAALSFEGGLGYAHTFFAGTAYKLENGSYEETRTASKPGVAAKISTGIYLRRQKRIQPYASYSLMADYTLPALFPPVAPHSVLQAGVRFLINP
ncbi:MAG: hypothetical protein AAGC85_03370 [Bacteroidota bacterium]